MNLEEAKRKQQEYLDRSHPFRVGQFVKHKGSHYYFPVGKFKILEVFQTGSGNYFKIMIKDTVSIIDINCYGSDFKIVKQ